VQVCHQRNTAVHMQECDAESPKRAFTRDELQALFDHADDADAELTSALPVPVAAATIINQRMPLHRRTELVVGLEEL
jgi:hypothetical protein